MTKSDKKNVNQVLITQTRSQIGRKPEIRATLRTLGLGRIGKQCKHAVSPALIGKIRVVESLISVEAV